MEIEGRKLDLKINYLDPVTYVPGHVERNCGHQDCEQGVIINLREDTVGVLYCKSRTVQQTSPNDLVWG